MTKCADAKTPQHDFVTQHKKTRLKNPHHILRKCAFGETEKVYQSGQGFPIAFFTTPPQCFSIRSYWLFKLFTLMSVLTVIVQCKFESFVNVINWALYSLGKMCINLQMSGSSD